MKKYLQESMPYYKRMLLIALPIMIQNGVTNFVSMLDNIMVGQVGTLQMTGVSIVNQLMFVFGLCIFGAMSGTGIFTAQFYGKKDTDGVRTTFQYKLITAVVLTVVGVAVFLLFGEELISAYIQKDSSPEDIAAVMAYSKSYLRIMLIQALPFAIGQAYASSLRETSDRVTPMVATVMAVAVNLVFNYALIFGHFGFPEMGIEGAAIATVIARFIECGILVVRTHTATKRYPFAKGLFTKFRFTRSLVVKITAVTLPLLFNEALWSGGMAFLNQCYSVRGLDVVAATNIVSTLNNVFNVSFISFGSAVGIILSQTLGAGKKQEAKKASTRLLWFSVVLIVFVALAMMCFAPVFPKIYNTTDEIKALSTRLLFIVAAFMPVQTVNNSCYFTLRSGGKTLLTFIFDCGFMWGVSATIAFCLSRFTAIPIEALFTCVLSLDIVKGIIGYILLKKDIWLNSVVETK